MFGWEALITALKPISGILIQIQILLLLVEMIQSSATGRGDRPIDDIEMRVSVID